MSNLEISRARRLDQYVIERIPQLSRGFASQLIANGKVTVNGEVQTKSGYKPKSYDDIVIAFDEKELTEIPTIDLEVLYEDNDCVVINKPAGLLVHSKGVFNPEATVASWLRQHVSEGVASGEGNVGTGNRAGIVHRLDRVTSGVMICAKNEAALSALQKQFSTRNVKKSYAAIIAGTMEPATAIIDMPIERNPKAPATFRVGVNGKPSQTKYETVTSNDTHSLLELSPTTGRTHQLRVHLQNQGHPIVGDVLYGGEPAERLFLHAHTLELTIPSRERKVFQVPIPKAFTRFMENPGAA